jgi:hypothetical protein
MAEIMTEIITNRNSYRPTSAPPPPPDTSASPWMHSPSVSRSTAEGEIGRRRAALGQSGMEALPALVIGLLRTARLRLGAR